jgi:hypothetical protein
MGSNLYRELVKLLSAAGCKFVRQAKLARNLVQPDHQPQIHGSEEHDDGSHRKQRFERRRFTEGVLKRQGNKARKPAAGHSPPLMGAGKG